MTWFTWGRVGEGVGANDNDFRFIAVKFEKVILHPGFYVCEADGRVECVVVVMVMVER